MNPNQVFYEEAYQPASVPAMPGQPFSRFPIGYTDGCIWIDGVHAYCENPDCPEVKESDEMGDHLPVGWTVQQADRIASLKHEFAQRGNNNAS